MGRKGSFHDASLLPANRVASVRGELLTRPIASGLLRHVSIETAEKLEKGENLLKNPEFAGHLPRNPGARGSFALCDDWFVETANASAVNVSSVTGLTGRRGVRLEATATNRWIRIWQPLSLAGVERSLAASVALRARCPEVHRCLEIQWIALLKEDSAGKRSFACQLMGSAKLEGPDWEERETTVLAKEFVSSGRYIFAVQLSQGPGLIELEKLMLTLHQMKPAVCDHGAAVSANGLGMAAALEVQVRAADAAMIDETSIKSDMGATEQLRIVPPRENTESGAVIKIAAGRLIGWAELPTSEREVLVIIDGRLVGSALCKGLSELDASGIQQIRTMGFELPIPADLLDGSERSVSLRSSSGKRIGRGSIRLLFRNHPEDLPTNSTRAGLAGPLPLVASNKSSSSAHHTAQRRIAVVSWDMAHNPVGRAFLLADMAARHSQVELVGPMFPMYGKQIWSPIAGSSMKMEAFPAPNFRAFLDGAKAIASRVQCDIVHVGKARFPSLLIGALIKQANKCPMVVDVDDHELSFFPNHKPATLDELLTSIRASPNSLDRPYSEIFTRFAESLIAECDAVTVSNYALQKRFGGIVVRHGRDERSFDPALQDRTRVRAEFGYGDADHVILFLGTPRPHKGIFEIAQAIDDLDDPHLALCVIGSITDARIAARFREFKRARIALHPDQPWDRLPALTAMADAVFLLQDSKSAISDFQIPAKLTDAMALGVPVYATPVAPLADLIAAGAVTPIADNAQLKAALGRISKQGIDRNIGSRARAYFLSELSYSVNAARLDVVFGSAEANQRQKVPALDELFSGLEQATGQSFPRFDRSWHAPAVWRNHKPDVVFLWKQNDSDIYGRRSDMVAKYLLKSGAVNKIIHFDAPINVDDLELQGRLGQGSVAHQGIFVHQNTVRRILGQADTEKYIRKTFLFNNGKKFDRFHGMHVPPRDGYGDFIRSALAESSISEAPLLWVCPVVFDYPLFRSLISPGATVADVIDDQRRFQAKEQYRQKIIQAYDDILQEADVVFANCEPVQKSFSDIRDDIKVIPNGAEMFDLHEKWKRPDSLKNLPSPILGYVGNLRDRVDLELIEKVADAFPHASVVLIGSAHDRPEVLNLSKRPNIHLLGVRPYDEVIRYIRAFDVALMPHLSNDLSESMNPLKLYVYFALGVPIVSTDVANIGDIAPFSTIAPTHSAFVSGVARVLAGKTAQPSPKERKQIVHSVSWETRIEAILAQLGLGRVHSSSV